TPMRRSMGLTLVRLKCSREYQTSPRYAERVTERNGAAVKIEVFCIVGNPEQAGYGERLHGDASCSSRTWHGRTGLAIRCSCYFSLTARAPDRGQEIVEWRASRAKD